MAYDARERQGHLRTRMRAVRNVDIVYRRGRLTATTTATVYERNSETLLAYGVELNKRMRDYIIDVGPLVSAGLGMPEQGDLVSEGTLVCQAIPLGPAAVYEYTSSRRDALRVHTQVIAD